MGVPRNHCEKILENVNNLRQTMFGEKVKRSVHVIFDAQCFIFLISMRVFLVAFSRGNRCLELSLRPVSITKYIARMCKAYFTISEFGHIFALQLASRAMTMHFVYIVLQIQLRITVLTV